MAFKMKGFPLRSGFAHAVNIDKHEHVDAGSEDQGEQVNQTEEVPNPSVEKQPGSDKPFWLDQDTQERITNTKAEIKKLENQIKNFPDNTSVRDGSAQKRMEMLMSVVSRLESGGK